MIIELDELKAGVMGLTEEYGSFLLQACSICLENQGHKSGINYELKGVKNEVITLNWSQKINSKVKRNWSDLQEATEYGATAIAISLANKYSEFDTVERSSKGTGFDYWLGEEDEIGIFQRKARLEISGILNESKTNTIKRRIKVKSDQVKTSDSMGLKAHISVTDFNSPKGQYLIK